MPSSSWPQPAISASGTTQTCSRMLTQKATHTLERLAQSTLQLRQIGRAGPWQNTTRHHRSRSMRTLCSLVLRCRDGLVTPFPVGDIEVLHPADGLPGRRGSVLTYVCPYFLRSHDLFAAMYSPHRVPERGSMCFQSVVPSDVLSRTLPRTHSVDTPAPRPGKQ